MSNLSEDEREALEAGIIDLEDLDEEAWMDDCGFNPDYRACTLAGTEHCEFLCPGRRLFAEAELK